MTIIEGIGDEVTYFFIAVLVVIIATIAWITTDIQQNFFVRTVYLLEHTTRQYNRVRLTNHTESATISEGVATAEVPADELTYDPYDTSSEESPITEEGPAEIIQRMDAPDTDETSTLRHRFTYIEEATVVDDQGDQAATNATNITIKLKYINDDLKIVDGRLEEKLGDFKRRHFHVELAANKLVRLIFNGQVLQHEEHTLESYGMFDNCVVHCLVHQPRSPAVGDATSSTPVQGAGVSNLLGGNYVGNAAAGGAQRDWDLGNLLIATLSFTLGFAWYFRYQYPQLFTISTTVGLIALTGMFSVISMSMYFPDLIMRVQVTTTTPAGGNRGEANVAPLPPSST